MFVWTKNFGDRSVMDYGEVLIPREFFRALLDGGGKLDGGYVFSLTST